MNLFSKLKYKLTSSNEPTDDGFAGELELHDEHGDGEFEKGIFLNSLDEFSEEDIQTEPGAGAKKLTVSEILHKAFFVFFLGVFVVSCVLLAHNIISKQKGNEIYNKLEEEFFSSGFNIAAADGFYSDEGAVKLLRVDRGLSAMKSMSDRINEEDSKDDAPVKEERNEELEKMRAGLTSLAQINPDIYGWISVAGTDINYPLVQGEDNDHYLNHAYTGDYLPQGSIFVDYRCNKRIIKNYNTVIYGHNIENLAGRTMFHDVIKFFDNKYFYETYIYIYTYEGIYIYEPFAIYETRYDSNYIRTGFMNANEFIEFAENMHARSAKAKDVEFTGNDRMLTLSTCTNGPYYARYSLHAKLIQVIKD